MAGGRWLVPPVPGLLLCILALHICVQNALAIAEHSVVAKNGVVAKNAAVAKNTLATTTKNAPVAKNVSMAITTKNAPVATTALVAITTKNASVAKNTLVATTTKNAPVAKNVSMAITTKNAPVATTALVAKNVSMAITTKNASVVTNASVATNASVNGKEETLLTCQTFQCSGERCYQDEAHANETVTCHNETHCELYRFSSTNYTARCSSTCGTEMCRTNGTGSTQPCALDCCSSSLCLQLNASSYGDLPPATVPPTTTTTTTTTRAPPRNGKVCAAFSCHGEGCFKDKKAVARCTVGHDFCEMKKTGLNYMAGCSRACKAAKPVCASGVKAACYQECCPATLKASCLKLDGKVHVNSAGQVTPALVLKLMACGVVLLLNYRVSASLWG